MALTFIDLFAGAGGLSEGFIQAGFTPIAHIEMDHYACDTLRTRAAFHYLKDNRGLNEYIRYLKNKKEKTNGSSLWNEVPNSVIASVIQAEISEKNITNIFHRVDNLRKERPIDVVIGGPPCQAYSVVGRARIGKKEVEKDPRNGLYKFYIKFLRYYQPKMFVFENVTGIKTAKNGKPFADIQKSVKKLGYQMDFKTQNAAWYNVLQNRKRVIIVGWKEKNDDGTPTNYKYPELIQTENEYSVLKDLFSDLPKRKSGEGALCGCIEYTKPISEMQYLSKTKIRADINFTTQHISRPNNKNDREIYYLAIKKFLRTGERLNYAKLPQRLQHHKNKTSFLNRFNVVNPFGKSHTVVAHIAMDGHYYIYPTYNPTINNVRSITIREAARLQSFPDSYFFEGSRSSAFKQIGNAVPVLLAKEIALGIKDQIVK